MSALAPSPTASRWADLCHDGRALVTRATDAHATYRRGVLTRRAVRLFRAMDEALEAGDGREAERLFRHAAAAARKAR